MGNNKRKTPGRSFPGLSAKKNRKDTKYEAEMQWCPNDIQKQQPVENLDNANQVEEQQGENLDNANQLELQPHNNGEFHKTGMRVQLRKHVKQRLDELTELLRFRFVGDTLDWLSPSETKALLELTKELGYGKGGETIDWLLSIRRKRISCLAQDSGLQSSGQAGEWLVPRGTKRLIEVTRELGFSGVGQTVKCFIAMARYKPLLELTNLLGFQNCCKTVDWLLNQTQRNVAAIKNASFSTTAPQSASSAMNIPPHFPPNQLERPVFPYPGGNTVSSASSSMNIPPHFPPNQLERPVFPYPGGGNTVSSSRYDNRRPFQTRNLAGLTPTEPTQTRNLAGLTSTQHLQVHQPSGIFRNHLNSHQMMEPIPNDAGNLYNVGEIDGRYCEFGMLNSQPLHSLQFRSNTSSWPQENQQRSHFQTNDTGLQGGRPHAESQFPNWMVGQEVRMQSNQSPNVSNCKPVQESNNNHINPITINQVGPISVPAPTQGLSQNPVSSVDLGRPAYGFPSSLTHMAGTRSWQGIQVQNNTTAMNQCPNSIEQGIGAHHDF